MWWNEYMKSFPFSQTSVLVFTEFDRTPSSRLFENHCLRSECNSIYMLVDALANVVRVVHSVNIHYCSGAGTKLQSTSRAPVYEPMGDITAMYR